MNGAGGMMKSVGRRPGLKTGSKCSGREVLVAGVFGLKGGSECPKRPNKIENGPIMKLGNPKHDKYGTRKLAKGGYHAPLQSACFQCFSI
jgi:hypothetical protein